MSTLLSLPNELSFQIFDDLDGADLFALAKSCRHLNIIATSYYLSHQQIPNPHLSINLIGKTFHVLPILRISVQLTSVDIIHSLFSPGHYLEEIRGLERLVVKLSSVRTVQLSLHCVGRFRKRNDADPFVQAVHGLLTCIMARSCASLTIRIPDLMYSYRPEEERVPRSRLSKFPSGFVAPFAHMLQKSPPKQAVHDDLSLDTSHAYKLTELRIDSSMLFHPLFHQWAIKFINASPITTLSLMHSSRRPLLWDDLLSAIHCPALSEFCITDEDQRIPFPSVLAFLARHQSITSLECKGLLRHHRKHRMVSLPGITKLVSSYESIVCLLAAAAAFPSLRDIFLDSFLDERIPFDSSVMNDALCCLRHCPNELKLSLTFDWDERDFATWLDVNVNDDGRVERSLHHVFSLTLFVGLHGDRYSNKLLLAFPKWLALFPALRIVSFQSRLPHERASQLNLVRSVIQACSQLERLTLNLEGHTVAAWLAMENLQ